MKCKCGAYITATYIDDNINKRQGWRPNSYCPACDKIKMLENTQTFIIRDNLKKRDIIQKGVGELEEREWLEKQKGGLRRDSKYRGF